MPLSWNEITQRAIAFTREWQNETSEDAEAKFFWDAFFNVFGVSRRRVASFEQPVKKDDGKQGYIDLLWKGVILVFYMNKQSAASSFLKVSSGVVPSCTTVRDKMSASACLCVEYRRLAFLGIPQGFQRSFLCFANIRCLC
jgi:hypothetical protein